MTNVKMVGCKFTDNTVGISASSDIKFDITDTTFERNGIAFQINDSLEFPGELVDLMKAEMEQSIKVGETKEQTIERLSKLGQVKQFASKHAMGGAMLLTSLAQLYFQVMGV